MKKIILYILELIFTIIIIISLFKIVNWYTDNKENKKIIDSISNSIKIKKGNKYSIDFKTLKERNPDTIAYIKVKNTNIDYPVVKYYNNDYYLNHNFDKKTNAGGWVFSHFQNKFDDTDKNIVLFAHNMKDKSMFGTLKYTLNNEWQNNTDNHFIILVTENNQYIYKVFSSYKIKNEDYYIKTNFNNEKEYEEFLNVIKNRSNYNYNVNLNKDDKILTLTTCADNNKYRVVLHAKKLKENKYE